MHFRSVIIILICALSLIQGDLNLSESEEDDSGSIEMPQRPENRQAAKESDGTKHTSDPNTFLALVSKFLNTVKEAIESTIQKTKFNNSRNGIQKSKKTLKGLYRAYNLAEKAQKQFMKHFSIKKKFGNEENFNFF